MTSHNNAALRGSKARWPELHRGVKVQQIADGIAARRRMVEPKGGLVGCNLQLQEPVSKFRRGTGSGSKVPDITTAPQRTGLPRRLHAFADAASDCVQGLGHFDIKVGAPASFG